MTGPERHDPRGVMAAAWLEATSSLDPDRLPGAALRPLVRESLEHNRRLLESSDEADRYEDDIERPTHVTIEGDVIVRGDDVFTLASALADAIGHCSEEGFCADCEASPAGMCGVHAEDEGKAVSYRELAAKLGLEAER